MRLALATLSLSCAMSAALATPAMAAPGVGDPVYGATINPGITEVEARYGRLTGGPDHGADGLVLEVEHGFSTRFSGAILAEIERAPGGPRRVSALSIEGVAHLARIEPLALDVALYGEYKLGRLGNADVAEGKLLIEHRAGGFDARLNLIAEKPLAAGEPVELSYAASTHWRLVGDEVQIGLTAFGDAGTTRHVGGRQELYAGPTAKLEIEHLGPGELEIETGWLRAFGAARDHADGQLRLLLDYECRF